jgi:dTDP-4-amino-4,6-dideoxygalactose transaminase
MAKLAALGGDPIRSKIYPKWPVFDERDVEAVTSAVKSGRWGGAPFPGPNTKAFAENFSELLGGGYAVPMMNGTITMEVAMRAANIGWGDEVIVPAYTFQATAAAPMAAGAIPVIVDISPENYCIDPARVEAAITPKTKAIFVVHLAAQMADMDAIMQIANRHNLVVVEDSAHAHGAQWRGMGAGSIGDFGSFSLQSWKILTTGEGGVLLCKDKHMAERVASIIDCGRPKDADGEEFTMGVNYRWSELHAALGLVALERFPEQFKEREAMADYLEESLSEVPGIRMLKHDLRQNHRNLYRYVIKIDPEFFQCENEVFCYVLSKEGIPVDTGYPPMNRYDLFQPKLSILPVPSAFPEYFDFENMHFPVTERASQSEAVWMGESIFRSGQDGIDDLVAGLIKLGKCQDQLAKLEAFRKDLLLKSNKVDFEQFGN